ncbi:hypothetical protein RvY_17103 [Ramazzottius varieornatus]|uniref:Uncharacterized protein n=1 Tax=Ramazzottius varieornatus TaxID=947166 RepID=A0A1D1W0Y9_RAMVA|nr:hypothetical protein RvY_17103 [Ramazzottius varieornatus]
MALGDLAPVSGLFHVLAFNDQPADPNRIFGGDKDQKAHKWTAMALKRSLLDCVGEYRAN